jgi:GT2 family glycosyltransferase/glycosyltransferase involved in cell wall biosynthesis
MNMKNRWCALAGLTLLAALRVERAMARRVGLLPLYHRQLARLVRRLGLFDEAHYLESNPDVSQAPLSPLQHYVAYGDREGRGPMPLFDVPYYRAHARGRLKNVNTLLHYALVGRYLNVSPSAWFDVRYYLAQNKDVARAGIEPLQHYLGFGGREGRAPCPQFDSDFYLRMNPDVMDAGLNPLVHYLRDGRAEGRCVMPGPGEYPGAADTAPKLKPIDDAEWDALPRQAGIAAQVDVIVPVYRGRLETLHCLCSLLKSRNLTKFEVIVIDDASPDQDLSADLKTLAERGLFTLLTNARNLGFVATVNRGMALHPERDVVLLNADAEVYGDWLDRLLLAAQRDRHVASVTPLSNNATICSYPVFLHDNPYPLEIGYGELDALSAEVNAGVAVEAPSAVGFCMYIARRCLDEIGLFDAKTFGRGYGEDNDFSQRAIAHGWKNLIAADVFVRHLGSVSFQGERAKRVDAAMAILDDRFPNYRSDVARFIADDPLADARANLDWARLQRQVREENILVINHNRGGGSERHVQEDIRNFIAAGQGVFVMRPQFGRPDYVCLSHTALKLLPNIPVYELQDTEGLTAVLKQLRITQVHSHGLVDFTPQAPLHLATLVQALGARLDINVHDYSVICPRINLADRSGLYCGEPDAQGCNTCLQRDGSDFGVTRIEDWRAVYDHVLRAADHVLVPDPDVKQRLHRYYPDLAMEVSPHEAIDYQRIGMRLPDLAAEQPLRIVVIGAIGKIKGFDVLLACARDAIKRNLPLEFVLLGYSLDDALLQDAGVQVTGRYLEHEAEERLHGLGPHVAWLPSLWPETYSYTLSTALRCGCPAFAFDLGAMARRLRDAGLDAMLMPLAHAGSAAAINHCFLEYRNLWARAGAGVMDYAKAVQQR